MQRALPLLLLGLAACPPPDTNTSADAPTTFIAFTDTFQPFRTWTSFHSDGPDPNGIYGSDAQVLGPRTQYINKLPPAGSTSFPVGTVIVEARENSTMRIFATVKRGGGFNATGAAGWEYFELTEASGPGSTVTMTWRGVGPPLGDTYGGDPNGCNSCHTVCGSGNDTICSAKLQLKDL
jgi:hypothetical protein